VVGSLDLSPKLPSFFELGGPLIPHPQHNALQESAALEYALMVPVIPEVLRKVRENPSNKKLSIYH